MRCATFIITLLVMMQIASAQQREYNFINFSSKNGLSSNSVNAIIKDRYGYMWFATEDGLNKFDGVHFTVYRHDPRDSTSIGTGAVLAMQEDRFGNLWVGAGRTLSLYNREKDAFINYDFTDRGLIRSLCTDHLGRVWVGTYTGLFMLEPRTGKIKTYLADPDKLDQLNLNAIICLFEDTRNRLWVGTIEGLHLYLENGAHFKRFLYSENDPFSIPDKIIRSVAEDFNGNMWFGTNSGGLCVLQPDGKSFKSYSHSASDNKTLSSDCIFTISVDNTGNIWAGTEDGLNIFNPQSAKTVRVMTDPRNRYSLQGKSVRSIFIDKDGIYWVGTFSGGVNKYDKNLAFFNLRQSNPFDPYGLNSSTITSFVENPAGDIYVGTDGGGLNLYHRKTGLFTHPKLTTGSHFKAKSILAMERAGNELWVGTYLEGLYVLNMVTGKVRHYRKGDGPKGLVSNEIFCIKQDSRGNVWVGTNGDGVSVYDPKSHVFHRFDPVKLASGNKKLPFNGPDKTI